MNQDKSVLIVGPTPPPMGGISTYVEDMLASEIKDRFSIMHLNTARDLSIKKSNIKNLILSLNILSRLSQILATEKPDIVHIHTSSYLAFWDKSLLLIVAKIFGSKTIMHVHGAKFDLFYNNSNHLKKGLIKYLLNCADTVIVLSSSWESFFRKIVDENKIFVLPNGVHYSKYESYNKNTEIEKYHHDNTNILFLGNLVERKGIYDVLKSINSITKKNKQVHFTFAGSEEVKGQIDEFRETCKDLGLEDYVTVKPNISDEEKYELFAVSDIFLLPSYAEGLPIAMLEAMASGLPVISSHVGGIPEVIDDGENGYLITPGDHLELANRIIKLIENPNLRMMMSKCNKQKIKDRYDWKNVANQISNQYFKLLG